MKAVTGSLKVELAQYRAMEAFAMFASDLDAASKQQLARGQRLMELFKQGQYKPFPVEQQVVSIWAATTGKLDAVPVEDVSRFESEFLDYLKRRTPAILDAIRETASSRTTTARLARDGVRLVPRPVRDQRRRSIKAGHEEFEALADEDVEQEQIVKQKRG